MTDSGVGVLCTSLALATPFLLPSYALAMSILRRSVKEHQRRTKGGAKRHSRAELNRKVCSGLLRLKVMELLYNVMDCSKNIFRQMLQLRQPVKTDIHRVVEENYTSPISLGFENPTHFSRIFKQQYGYAPSQS